MALRREQRQREAEPDNATTPAGHIRWIILTWHDGDWHPDWTIRTFPRYEQARTQMDLAAAEGHVVDTATIWLPDPPPGDAS